MKRWFIIVIQLIAIQVITTAQIAVKGLPVSFNNELKTSIPVIEIANISHRLALTSDKIPLQAGYTLLINSELSEKGTWEKVDKKFVWRIEIEVQDAIALNLYFNSINLLVDEKLFVYSPNSTAVLGAFTNINNGSFMCTDFVHGDRIIIEFNSLKLYNQLPFLVHEVGILLANSKNKSRGFGNAGKCEVHVNCIEGEDWQNNKEGVTRILVKQDQLTFWCTGSLINNTNIDGTPYFLTANHCGEFADSTDYAQWLFYFNYESENCEQPVFEPELLSLSGSSLLSRAPNGIYLGSDFKLLLLKNEVPLEYKPYYNGWDRTGEISPSGVTIHHPQGDLKMISTYTNPLLSTNYDNQNEDPNGKYWMVHWAKTVSGHGVTEGGSSGSPIFNNEGNIIGALTGGGASCTFLNEPDYYGKFSYSWESNGSDSTTQLSYWLDPKDSGITKLDGTNLDSTNVFAGFSGEPTTIIINESVNFINTSFGNITEYSWYFEGGTPSTSKSKEPMKVEYNIAGEYNVKLIVSSADGIDSLIRKDYVKVLPNISPNPSNGKVKLVFGNAIPDDITIRIFNYSGKETVFREVERSDNCLIIEILPKTQGLYFIKLSSTYINNTFKIIIDGSKSPTPCN